MMKTGIFSGAFLCLLLLCGCSFGYFEMGKQREASYEQVEADGKGWFYLKDSVSRRGVIYEGFKVKRIKGSPLKVYVQQNSPNTAVWRIDPAEFGGEQLVCTASRIVLPMDLSQKMTGVNDLSFYCKFKFSRDPQMQHFSVNVSEWKEEPAAEFILKTAPAEGKMQVTHGFVVFHPYEPGVLLEIRYHQTDGGEKTLELREFGEKFLQSVVPLKR